jgi:hypothetical protein
MRRLNPATWSEENAAGPTSTDNFFAVAILEPDYLPQLREAQSGRHKLLVYALFPASFGDRVVAVIEQRVKAASIPARNGLECSIRITTRDPLGFEIVELLAI